MALANCWEVKKCGREPGGAKVAELGVCAATRATSVNGVHGGRNGGRACWAVAGTLCGGKVQGTFAAKFANYIAYEFYGAVKRDAGALFAPTSQLLPRLRG